MKHRILVGYNGRGQSRGALELARRLVSGLEAELSLAAVLEYDPLPPLDLDPYETALAERFDEILGLAVEHLDDIRFETHRLTGTSPASELARLAERLEADLLVIGSGHHGPLGRVYPGSVGASLLSVAPCPVAVAPRGFSELIPRPIETIGVGYDARGEAEAALGVAASLAAGLDASLQLIAVVSYRTPVSPRFGAALDLRAIERESLTAAVATAASSLTAEVSGTEIADGYPATILVERSDQLDLLVIGSRGYGPLRRVLLGGVATRVIREAECPVIVVPRAVKEGLSP